MRKIIMIVVAVMLVATVAAALIFVFKINSDLEIVGGTAAGSNSAAGSGNVPENTAEPGGNTGSGSITNPNVYQDEEVELSAPWRKIYVFQDKWLENPYLVDSDYASGPSLQTGIVFFASVQGGGYTASFQGMCLDANFCRIGQVVYSVSETTGYSPGWWLADTTPCAEARVSVWYYQEQTITGLLEVSEREDRVLIFNPQKNILTLNSGYYAGIREVNGQAVSDNNVACIGSNNTLFFQYENSYGYDFTKASGTISLQPGDIYAFFYRKPGDETFYMVNGSAECELGIRMGANHTTVDGVLILPSDQSTRTLDIYVQHSMPILTDTLPEGYVLYCFLLESDEHVEVIS